MNDYSVDQMIDLLDIKNDLINAYESLTDSMKDVGAVQDIMSNIQVSLDLLSKYGQTAIPHLNLDKGLESLMGIPEKLITAEKAMEALEGEKKNLWQRFVAWVKEFCRKIVQFFRDVRRKFSIHANNPVFLHLNEQLGKTRDFDDHDWKTLKESFPREVPSIGVIDCIDEYFVKFLNANGWHTKFEFINQTLRDNRDTGRAVDSVHQACFKVAGLINTDLHGFLSVTYSKDGGFSVNPGEIFGENGPVKGSDIVDAKAYCEMLDKICRDHKIYSGAIDKTFKSFEDTIKRFEEMMSFDKRFAELAQQKANEINSDSLRSLGKSSEHPDEIVEATKIALRVVTQLSNLYYTVASRILGMVARVAGDVSKSVDLVISKRVIK